MDSFRENAETLIVLTADIVAAHLSNNRVALEDVSNLISSVHAALSGLGDAATRPEGRADPAVSVRASVKKDHLVCLDCGRKLKTLKRHLSVEHELSPAAYRQRWSLPFDYPMTASAYSETRKDLARRFGLGRKPVQRAGKKKKV
ncbi:MucR family transcriptional regulator [Erythrobacter sp.]|uniref:MucR family transcriptional regulator n=1 Tax=Erythrobacter sp. TaxID=1042 RepID=UPI00311EA6F1